MSIRDNGATRLRSLHPAPANGNGRPLLGLHDYGRLEIAAFQELDMLSPMRPRLARLLSEARVVPSPEIPANVITLGTTVRYRVDGDRMPQYVAVEGFGVHRFTGRAAKQGKADRRQNAHILATRHMFAAKRE